MDFGRSVILEREKDAESDVDSEQLSAAHHAAAAGDTEKLIRLIQVDPTLLEQQDADGLTPLGHSVLGRRLGAVKKLVKMGANVNAQDNLGRTGLVIAAYQGWPEGVIYLLRHGAKFPLCDKSGRTALHASTYDADYRTMCALLHNLSTSDLNKRDHEGMTALHWGAFHNRPDHVRILLERGADIFREDIDGKTALHWAAQKGNLQCCELLYKWKDGVLLLNHTDHAGKSPVHFAAAAGNLAVIREFASVDDCDLEAEDPDDRTPLHWAVATGQTACVCLLLEIGVAPNPVDIEGCSPLDYARLSKHKECQKILEEKLGLNSVSRPLGTNLPQFKISPVPAANKTTSKVSFFRNLFGKSSKKRSNIHEATSDISNCDMKSYDMALMREEHLNGREETMNPISNLESQESSIQRETTIERDNVVDNPNNHLPYETNGCDQSSESKEYTAHTKGVDSLLEKTDHYENVTFDKGDNSPNLKVNDELPHVTRRVSINLEGEEVLSDPKFRAPAGLQPDLPVPVRRVQSLQPVPVSQSHEPVKQAVTSPSLPRRALGGDLAPLKGPKPPTGLTIHEKVIALRMEKTGPARSPTPPSWVERSFDPLSPRQQPGRSPLLAAENRANKGLNIPSQMEVHRRGSKTITRASVDLTNVGQPPLYLEHGAHSSMSKGSNSSDGDSRHNSGTSSPITKTRPEKSPRRPTGGQRSNATTGVFSAQERKQLDKQLHNLLL